MANCNTIASTTGVERKATSMKNILVNMKHIIEFILFFIGVKMKFGDISGKTVYYIIHYMKKDMMILDVKFVRYLHNQQIKKIKIENR